ncbi:beta-N-acetylhexosaminidase [Tessaracoccus caeni]|uniref:beta-N-acetylhexosaminidase n=1 Tax=Tessaracoccus caeni TaxID=3031239 RepID=UPI0023DCD09A|nr:beta-N-acetylhexosaminidase [Tessaracoccus caeni]MDF1488243.1 beta-N-acetylhexosaminidase [Tessaracoccus caeni]
MAPHTSFDLIPAPSTVRPGERVFALPSPVRIAVDERLSDGWSLIVDILSRRLGLVPQAVDADADVSLRLDPQLTGGAYRLEVVPSPHRSPAENAGCVQIVSSDTEGAVNALRTLQQLIGERAFRLAPIAGTVTVPEVAVDDAPLFGYRGVLLDVARNFLPKDQVLRFIDLASMHKLNVVQLHLTDDQGWRMEVRAYPRLTEVGSWRTESQVGSSRSTLYDGQPHGGYYTQDDLREIVAFARSRGITVVPEIDVPGHSQAAMAAYPELSAAGLKLPVWTSWGLNRNALDTSEFVVDFYCTVLDELMEIFDSPIICIGGDEVNTEQWIKNPRIVRQAEELGLDDVDELLPWFSARLADHVRSRGRRTSVWDEVGGARVPRDIIVNSWRGYRGGLDAVRDGHDVVVCPEHKVFLDHRAAPGLEEPVPVGTVHTLEDVYHFEPLTDEIAEAATEPGAGTVLGAQAQLWREQLPDSRRTDYAAYPRLCAFAEVVWTPKREREWDDFRARLGTHLTRLDASGVEYRPLDGPKPWQRRPGVPGYPLRFDELGNLVPAPGGEK